MKFNRYHAFLISIILIGMVLFFYVFTKVGVSSFTHDESYTYLNYPHDSFTEIISFSNWFTNNHILNTLFIKYSEKLFGNSELALRLPNLILLLVYMFYSYRLFIDKNHLLGIAMFLLLGTNVLLMDLFGLARGYGLSFGFMLMSMYHFMEYLKGRKTLHIILFHLAALLASLSSFTLLTFYAAMLLVYNVLLYIDVRIMKSEKFRFFQLNKVHLIPLLLVFVILYEPLRRLLTYNDLNFGGKQGFYADTVSELIFNTFHYTPISPSVLLILQIIFTLIILISFVIIVRSVIQRKREFFNQYIGLIISNFLLIILSVIIILQHIILKTDYPIGRFSVFLFPLFIIHLGFFIHYLIVTGYKKTSLITISLVALISAISFYDKADFSSSAEWTYDSKTKNMIQTLTTYRELNHDKSKNIKLGINWVFEPTINYYIKRYEIDWLLPADREGISVSDDYFYIFKDDFNKLQLSDYEIIKEYNEINTLLIKNNTGKE